MSRKIITSVWLNAYFVDNPQLANVGFAHTQLTCVETPHATAATPHTAFHAVVPNGINFVFFIDTSLPLGTK